MRAFSTVLPAYAGMIPRFETMLPSSTGAPRIRGDDPYTCISNDIFRRCSPHTRG